LVPAPKGHIGGAVPSINKHDSWGRVEWDRDLKVIMMMIAFIITLGEIM